MGEMPNNNIRLFVGGQEIKSLSETQSITIEPQTRYVLDVVDRKSGRRFTTASDSIVDVIQQLVNTTKI